MDDVSETQLNAFINKKIKAYAEKVDEFSVP